MSFNNEGRRFFVFFYIKVARLKSVKGGSLGEAVFCFINNSNCKFLELAIFFQDFYFSPRLQFHILQVVADFKCLRINY